MSVLILIAYCLLSMGSVRFAKGDKVNPGVFSIDSKPYGIGYPQWTAKWWQWIMSMPEKDNPNSDETGQKCNLNQNEPKVWYLAPTFGGAAVRNCVIPQGKAILFPILTGECDYLSDSDIKTQADLRKCAMSVNQGGTVQATVDGKPLKSLENYRVQSPLFSFIIPPNNAFGGGKPGTTLSIADGYYAFLEPLSPGRHTIHFSGSVVDNPTQGSNNYATDVKYNLLIKP